MDAEFFNFPGDVVVVAAFREGRVGVQRMAAGFVFVFDAKIPERAPARMAQLVVIVKGAAARGGGIIVRRVAAALGGIAIRRSAAAGRGIVQVLARV